MNSPVSFNPWMILARSSALAAAAWLAGCATAPDSYQPGRTQYKGDAVWNISAVDGATWQVGSKLGRA